MLRFEMLSKKKVINITSRKISLCPPTAGGNFWDGFRLILHTKHFEIPPQTSPLPHPAKMLHPPPPISPPSPKKRTFSSLSRRYAQGLQSARRKAAILS